MKIHEYQAKEILRRYGVATPRGVPCFSVEEAVKAAQQLGGKVWVVKAQIHAGGRGKGGGVKVARSREDAEMHVKNILGMQLITHQTGPQGQKVQRLLIEETAAIDRELYLGIVLDRAIGKLVFMASQAGGMEIEEVAAKDLAVGDVIRIRPGDNVAADGLIVTGQGSFNQATITGESLPVDKKPGDEVFAVLPPRIFYDRRGLIAQHIASWDEGFIVPYQRLEDVPLLAIELAVWPHNPGKHDRVGAEILDDVTETHLKPLRSYRHLTRYQLPARNRRFPNSALSVRQSVCEPAPPLCRLRCPR